MRIGDLLETTDIVFSLRALEIGSAAEALLRTTLPARGYAQSEIDRLCAAVVSREREAATLCGPIAIPHARDSRLTSFIAGVGVNPEGILDGQPMPRIVFAFVSPDTERTEHLALLASLARLSRDSQFVEAIVKSATPESVIDVIRRAQ